MHPEAESAAPTPARNASARRVARSAEEVRRLPHMRRSFTSSCRSGRGLEPRCPPGVEPGATEASRGGSGLQDPGLEIPRFRTKVSLATGGGMRDMKTENLRVLIADEDETSPRLVASLVASLGHDAIARAVDAQDVGVVARTERPDIALVAP